MRIDRSHSLPAFHTPTDFAATFQVRTMSTADLELPEGAEPEETLFEASYNAGDESERRFDEIISALEDAVMTPEDTS